VGGEVREVAIEEEVGCALVAELVEVAKVGLAGSDDEDIDAAAEEGANLLELDLGIFFRRGEEQGVLAGAQDATEGLGELGEEGMDEIGNDKADCVGLSASEATGSSAPSCA